MHAVPHGSVCVEILFLSMLTMLIFKCSFHDVHAQLQLCFMRSFDFHKSSLTVLYPIGHAQLAITETKTKKKKQKKRKTILEKKN